MGKVRFRCRDMVKITFLDSNVFPVSTISVDPGTHLTQQNKDVRLYTHLLFYLCVCVYVHICARPYERADKLPHIIICWQDCLMFDVSVCLVAVVCHCSSSIVFFCLVCLHSCQRRMLPCCVTYLECYTGYTLTQRWIRWQQQTWHFALHPTCSGGLPKSALTKKDRACCRYVCKKTRYMYRMFY